MRENITKSHWHWNSQLVPLVSSEFWSSWWNACSWQPFSSHSWLSVEASVMQTHQLSASFKSLSSKQCKNKSIRNHLMIWSYVFCPSPPTPSKAENWPNISTNKRDSAVLFLCCVPTCTYSTTLNVSKSTRENNDILWARIFHLKASTLQIHSNSRNEQACLVSWRLCPESDRPMSWVVQQGAAVQWGQQGRKEWCLEPGCEEFAVRNRNLQIWTRPPTPFCTALCDSSWGLLEARIVSSKRISSKSITLDHLCTNFRKLYHPTIRTLIIVKAALNFCPFSLFLTRRAAIPPPVIFAVKFAVCHRNAIKMCLSACRDVLTWTVSSAALDFPSRISLQVQHQERVLDKLRGEFFVFTPRNKEPTLLQHLLVSLIRFYTWLADLCFGLCYPNRTSSLLSAALSDWLNGPGMPNMWHDADNTCTSSLALEQVLWDLRAKRRISHRSNRQGKSCGPVFPAKI